MHVGKIDHARVVANKIKKTKHKHATDLVAAIENKML